MSPEASLRAWMPAILAGMTNSEFSSFVSDRKIMNYFVVNYFLQPCAQPPGVCSLFLSLCFREIRGRIPAQVSFQEILSFRERDTIITFALDLQTQICPTALQ
jgi:hypothetical protein